MKKYQGFLLAFMTVTLCLVWPQSGFAQNDDDAEPNADQQNDAEKPAPSGDAAAPKASPAGTPDDNGAAPETGTDTDGGDAEAAEAEEGESLGFQRSGRMEFDERLVKGQAAKSGAVYLFKRTPRRLPGLVPFRRSYRTRIVEPVLGKRELKTPTYSTEEASKDDEQVAEGKDTDNKMASAEGDEEDENTGATGDSANADKDENGKGKGKKKKKRKSKRKKKNGKHRRKTGGTK